MHLDSSQFYISFTCMSEFNNQQSKKLFTAYFSQFFVFFLWESLQKQLHSSLTCIYSSCVDASLRNMQVTLLKTIPLLSLFHSSVFLAVFPDFYYPEICFKNEWKLGFLCFGGVFCPQESKILIYKVKIYRTKLKFWDGKLKFADKWIKFWD